MKLVLPLLFVSISAFAAKPTRLEVQEALKSYYEGNAKWAECVTKLNSPPKPMCHDCFYPLYLQAAAFAEGVKKICE